MNQRKIMMIGLMIVCILLGGFSIYAIKNSEKFKKMFSKPESQWKWDDSWNGNMPENSSSKSIGPVEPKAKPDTKPEIKPENKPQDPKAPYVVGNYIEALKISGETGKPVLVFYTAEWCGFCKKMKSETISNEKVSDVLKNYILVYVDIDHDRGGIGKFGVTTLPAFVITNNKEEKLKMNSGFMDSDAFLGVINDSKMFSQPKNN